jgi:transcriptional antiterminator RfaH
VPVIDPSVTSSLQPAWYVIRTHARHELRADQNLRAGGIDSFLPMIRAPRSRRYYQYSSATPLFPQYLFARFDLAARLHDVSFTRGVQSVVYAGSSPASIDDGFIALLRSRIDPTGLIRIGEPLQPGERVIVADGPFLELAGIVERVLPERERVIVLLTAVEASVRLDLTTDAVRRVSASAC